MSAAQTSAVNGRAYDDSPTITLVAHPIMVWSQVADWIEAALDEWSIIDLSDIFNAVLSRQMTLWTISVRGRIVAAFVTKIESGSRGRALNIIALGGVGMEDWIESFVLAVESYGRANGCRFVFEMGRPGWTRVFGRYGWTPGPTTTMRTL